MAYQDKGLIFAGDLYLGAVDSDGKLTGGMTGPINVPQFQITPPTVNTVVRQSKQRATYGQALDSVNVPGDPASISIQFDSLPAETLAEALGGTVQQELPVAGSVTGETVIVSQLGDTKPLDHTDIIPASVTVTVDGTGVLTEGDDYRIDYAAGTIRAISALAVDELSVDYDYTGTSSTKTGDQPDLVLNEWVDFSFAGIRQGTLVNDESLTEGTDYEVNYGGGMIKALTEGAVNANAEWDYTYEIAPVALIKGATEINKPRRIKLIGQNLATGENAVVTIDFANLNADQATDLMQSDFVTGQLTGNLRTLPNNDAPYTIRITK